jgi:hypothetical protein
LAFQRKPIKKMRDVVKRDIREMQGELQKAVTMEMRA